MTDTEAILAGMAAGSRPSGCRRTPADFPVSTGVLADAAADSGDPFADGFRAVFDLGVTPYDGATRFEFWRLDYVTDRAKTLHRFWLPRPWWDALDGYDLLWPSPDDPDARSKDYDRLDAAVLAAARAFCSLPPDIQAQVFAEAERAFRPA